MEFSNPGANKMADRLNVVKTLKVTTSDGQPFFDAVIEYHGMQYPAFLELEKAETRLMAEMTEFAERAMSPKP